MSKTTLTATFVALTKRNLRSARLIMHSNAKIDLPSEPVVAPCVLLARSSRTDARTARIIYRALALRDAFGLIPAGAFAAFHRVPAALWERVLSRKTGAYRR